MHYCPISILFKQPSDAIAVLSDAVPTALYFNLMCLERCRHRRVTDDSWAGLSAVWAVHWLNKLHPTFARACFWPFSPVRRRTKLAHLDAIWSRFEGDGGSHRLAGIQLVHSCDLGVSVSSCVVCWAFMQIWQITILSEEPCLRVWDSDRYWSVSSWF